MVEWNFTGLKDIDKEKWDFSGLEEKPKKKERKPREIKWYPFREPLKGLKEKITKPFKKIEKGIEKVGKKVITGYEELKPDFEILKKDLQQTSAEIPSRILYEPINKIVDFTDQAINSAGQFVADPSEYDEEGNLTLFPKIRGTMLLGALVVEGVALAGGMKAGLAYRKSMQTFEKWKKTLGERKLKVEFDKYLKSTKFKDTQRNMRTFFERITKWFRRKPRPVGEKLGREIRFRGRLPEIEKKELFAMKEETAIKNIEQTIRQVGQVDRNLKKAGFKIERPAYYLKTEQKPFITDNILAVKNIPTAEGGKGVALANIDLGSVKLFKNPIEIKQELIRLSLDNITKPAPIPTIPTRVPLEEITPEQAQAELAQRRAGLKFPDETEQEMEGRIEALKFYAEPIVEEKVIKEIPKEKMVIKERIGLRRLDKMEIHKVRGLLEIQAMKTPPDERDIKYAIEDVIGTLPKEEMDAAIKDIKAYIEKPTEESIETILDGAGKADENSFPEEWARWRELGKRWEGLSDEEKKEFWEIADKISDRVSEGVIPPDEMLGFPLGDLKEDWKLSGIKGFLSTAGGILPYGLDIHAWFPKQAIQSARAVKTMMTKQERMHKMAEWIIRKIHKAGKKLNITTEDYIESFIPATQRALLKNYSPEQQKKFNAIFEITDKFFEEQLAISKKKGIVEMGFVQRVAREAKENIKQYLAAMKKAKTSARKADLETRLKEEQEVLEFIKKMDVRYIHLPVKMLFEEMWTNPALKRYLKFSRFFRRRETLDVASWIKEFEGKRYPEAVRNTRAIRKEITKGTAQLVKGDINVDKELVITRPVLDKNMLDIRRVIAAYSDKLGRLYGLADIVNAFQHDGLIRDLPATGIIPDGWNTLPSGLFPEFKGKIAKGVVADWLKQYLKDVFKHGLEISRIFAYFKLMQFTRLLFMPYYDVKQAAIHWGLRWALMKPHKVPGVVLKAIKSFVKKDEHFWNFWNYGGPSKPFAAPFKSYMNEIEVILEQNKLKKLLKFIAHHYKTPVDFLYLPIWNINWAGDELVRLISYHAMLEEGHTPEEAAQIAATAHSDYARMPVDTRRKLNKVLFVPVFPVTMALWEYEMMKAAVLESMRIGAKGLGKVFPPMKKLEAKLTPTAETIFKRRKSMAKGLLGLVMMVALREGIQKALGYKRDVIGLRYTRLIEDPDNPGQQKELVKYIPTPDNVLLRHIFRWSGFPSEPDKLDYFWMRAGGILHPLLAFFFSDCLRNRKRDFTRITELSQIWEGPEGWAKIGLDYLAYAGERLIPILKSVPGLATEYREEREKAIREWRKGQGPYWFKRIYEPFIFLYMRNTKDKRGIRQAKEFLRLIRQEAREAERIKGGPLSNEEIRRYEERIIKMEDSLLNITEKKERVRPVRREKRKEIKPDEWNFMGIE